MCVALKRGTYNLGEEQSRFIFVPLGLNQRKLGDGMMRPCHTSTGEWIDTRPLQKPHLTLPNSFRMTLASLLRLPRLDAL